MKKNLIIGIFMIFMFAISFVLMADSVSASQWTASEEQQKATGTTATTTENINLSLDENGIVVVEGAEKKRATYVNKMLKNLTVVMTGFAGLADIILFGILVKNITGFAASGSNPTKRQSAITKLLINAVAIALCGGVCLIFYLLYNSFK